MQATVDSGMSYDPEEAGKDVLQEMNAI